MSAWLYQCPKCRDAAFARRQDLDKHLRGCTGPAAAPEPLPGNPGCVSQRWLGDGDDIRAGDATGSRRFKGGVE